MYRSCLNTDLFAYRSHLCTNPACIQIQFVYRPCVCTDPICLETMCVYRSYLFTDHVCVQILFVYRSCVCIQILFLFRSCFCVHILLVYRSCLCRDLICVQNPFVYRSCLRERKPYMPTATQRTRVHWHDNSRRKCWPTPRTWLLTRPPLSLSVKVSVISLRWSQQIKYFVYKHCVR